MSAQIRPTRIDITDRFPMVAFKIRADGNPSRAEVAIGVDPSLFTFDGKKNRTAANFYSTRGNGGVRFSDGEAGATARLASLCLPKCWRASSATRSCISAWRPPTMEAR
jgi:hypothetical protein